jgi:signal transduction histidine kinase/ActR/RegA family two-component response regulator
LEPARVLIVDDLTERVRGYGAMLEGLGAEIVPAGSRPEALDHAGSGDFAVILLAMDRPGLGGLETASQLRRSIRSQRTPLVFVAPTDEQLQTLRDCDLRAVDYLPSPVVPQMLRSKVRVYIHFYRAHADLARSYRQLEAHVAERTRELEQSNQRLQAQIAERRRVEREREALLRREQVLRAEAEQLSRLKDEFLATMSHELRTPLNAIFGWITLLRTRRLDGPTVERALETIERNARAQKRLIEDLLDVSRVVTGKVTLELSVIDPKRIIEASIETMLPAAQAKDIALVTTLDPGVGVLRGDSARLQQIVCNLLSNAIKFTRVGGRVEVRLCARGSEAEIAVSDDGQGIKPEFLPYVFDRFRQEDGSISRRHGGLGLGLAIVRHLAELHGGTVTADSEGEGRGATFTIRVPIRHATATCGEDAPLAPPRSERLAGVHVLVVDDDPGAREVIARILQGLGARVSLAASGPAALTLLLEHRPNVLVADLGMPVMDGYALIEQIRALDPQFGGLVPAVAVTAYASLQDRLRALRCGYQNHIAKPVEPEELAAVITSLAVRAQRGSSA